MCTVQGDEDASQEGPPSSPANKDKSPAVPTASGAVSPASMTPPQAGAGASTNSASANLAPPAQAGISAEQGPGWGKFQDSYLTFLNAPGMLTPSLSLSACFFEPSSVPLSHLSLSLFNCLVLRSSSVHVACFVYVNFFVLHASSSYIINGGCDMYLYLPVNFI